MTNTALKKHIGRHLQAARKAAGYKSAKAYAEHIGISKDTYTGYEQGRIAFSIETGWLFADDLGVSIDELCGHDTPKRAFSDPLQSALNAFYESMNSQGRNALVESARLMSGSPDTRIEKDRETEIPVLPPMERIA